MADQREFDADNWAVRAEDSISCGICGDLVALSPRTKDFAMLHQRRGAFLAHCARKHLHLLAGGFNSELEYEQEVTARG